MFLAYTASVVEDIRPTFLRAYTVDITFVVSKFEATLSLYFLWISLLHEMECGLVIPLFCLFLLYVICLPPAENYVPLLVLASTALIPLARFLPCLIKLSSAENLYG